MNFLTVSPRRRAVRERYRAFTVTVTALVAAAPPGPVATSV
jgi:hypothetical protein